MEHEVDGDTICNWWTRNNPQSLATGAGRAGNLWLSWEYPNYNIVVIGQNIKKSPGYLGGLAVTHSSERLSANHPKRGEKLVGNIIKKIAI